MAKLGSPQEMGTIRFHQGFEDDYLQSFMLFPVSSLDAWDSRDEVGKTDIQYPT